jgi:hypothetical protein
MDRDAKLREKSHVEKETLAEIRSLALEEMGPEAVIETARRLVPKVSDEQLAQVVADWLDAQVAL